jgi:hypothetical protein
MMNDQSRNGVQEEPSPGGRHSVAGAVRAPPRVVAAVEGLKALRVEREILEAEEERLRGIVQTCMGQRESLLIDNRVAVTWMVSRPARRFDGEAFRVAHADLYRKFCKTGPVSRRFLLK